ncbi:MAG TPA: FHA domain-containing protein [Polyangia bacterium]|jgi:pSer/pThr/pTyr-binding forkhead associated (FHA) protein
MGRERVEAEREREPAAPGLDAELDRALPAGDAIAFLILANGEQPGRVYGLSRNTVVVGRLDEADIHLGDPSVSARHARIINGGHGFEIEDLNSTNGTFIGGRRIRRTRLTSGEKVTIGNVDFTFVLERRTEATIRLSSAGDRSLTTVTSATLTAGPRSRRPRSADDEDGPSLVDIIRKVALAYRFIRARAKLIGTLALVGVGLGIGSLAFLPPPPTAVCEVRLLPRVKSNPVETQWHPPDDDSAQFFGDAERSFTSADLVRGTLTSVEGHGPTDARVQAVAGRLRLEGIGDHRYRASYLDGRFDRGHPPPTPFLTAHINAYVQSEVDRALHGFSAEVDFLRDQLKTVEADLATVSAERTRFRESNADRLPEEAAQTQASRFQLQNRRSELVAQVRRLEGEIENTRRRLDAGEPLAQARLQSSQAYRDSLGDTNRKLSEAQAKGFTDEHPDVQQLKEEKRRLEGLVEAEMSSHTSLADQNSNPGLQAMRAQLDGLQGQLKAARDDLADTEAGLGQVRQVVGDLPRVQEHIEELNHAQEGTMRLHGQLFDKLKKAELQLNLERVSAQSRLEVLTSPRLERPRRSLTLVLRATLGLLLGLFVAAALIGWSEGRRLISDSLAALDHGRLRT